MLAVISIESVDRLFFLILFTKLLLYVNVLELNYEKMCKKLIDHS